MPTKVDSRLILMFSPSPRELTFATRPPTFRMSKVRWKVSRSPPPCDDHPVDALALGCLHDLFNDPALAASLLGATASSMTTPRHSHLAGPLFEALATLTVRVAAEAARARVGHLRTRNGDHEIDLIAETRDGRIVAIEVKLAASVTEPDVQHLVWLRSRLPEDVADLVILTTGTTAYRRRDGVAVIPLALLGP